MLSLAGFNVMSFLSAPLLSCRAHSVLVDYEYKHENRLRLGTCFKLLRFASRLSFEERLARSYSHQVGVAGFALAT